MSLDERLPSRGGTDDVEGRGARFAEEVHLTAAPWSAREARLVAARVCAAAVLPPDVCETTALLASELVTNAILHAKTAFRMTVVANPAAIRVEVADGAVQVPLVKEQSPEALGGRGMYLVESCASRWGVNPMPDGKVVWFEIRAA